MALPANTKMVTSGWPFFCAQLKKWGQTRFFNGQFTSWANYFRRPDRRIEHKR
jgi:hypothetical protein